MTDIAKLAERLRAATGTDRELDVSICLALNYMPYIDDQPLNMRHAEHETTWLDYECMENGKTVECTDDAPSLTKSVDAALALVERKLPEANCVGIELERGQWCGYVSRNGVKSGHWFKEAYAPTPALALLAALLSALSSGDAS